MEDIDNNNAIKKRKLELIENIFGISDHGSDSNNEISRKEQLFWKVYKNVFLKRKILNNLSVVRYANGNISFKSRSKKYSEINSVEWMLINGHTQLLRYKVIHDDKDKSLLFNYSHLGNDDYRIERNEIRVKYDKIYMQRCVELPNSNLKHHFFNIIKEKSNENIEFYKTLFTNYPEYFQTSLEYTVYLLTEYDCIAALVVCIEEFGYIPNVTMFKRCIEIGSYKCCNYLKDHYKFGQSLMAGLIGNNDGDGALYRFWYEMIFDTTIQMVMSRPTEINSRIKYLLSTDDGLGVKLPTNTTGKDNILNQGIGHIFHCVIFNLKLSELIECAFTIHSLYPLLKKFIKSISDNKYRPPELGDYSNSNVIEYFYQNFQGIPILSIDQINEIKSNFTKQQLDLNVYEISNKIKSIKQLYEMVLLFTNTDNLQNNYSFYQFKYCGKPVADGLDSIKFGNFILEGNLFSDDFRNMFPDSKLFEYCSIEDDKDIVAKYIDDWLEYQHVNQWKQKVFIFSFLSNKMFTMELLDKIFNSLPQLVKDISFIIKCFEYIKCVVLFDYFFKYLQPLISNVNGQFSNIYQKDYLEKELYKIIVSSNFGGMFINHLKSNYQEYYKKLVTRISSLQTTEKLFSMSSLLAVHENKSDFPIDFHCVYSIDLGKRIVGPIRVGAFAFYFKFFDWLNCNFTENEITTLISKDSHVLRNSTKLKNNPWLIYKFLNFKFWQQITEDYNSSTITTFFANEKKESLDWLELVELIASTGDLELLDFVSSIHPTQKFYLNLFLKVIYIGNLKILNTLNNHNSQLFKDLHSYGDIFNNSTQDTRIGIFIRKLITIIMERGDIYLFNELYSIMKFDYKLSNYNGHNWLTQYLKHKQ